MTIMVQVLNIVFIFNLYIRFVTRFSRKLFYILQVLMTRYIKLYTEKILVYPWYFFYFDEARQGRSNNNISAVV